MYFAPTSSSTNCREEEGIHTRQKGGKRGSTRGRRAGWRVGWGLRGGAGGSGRAMAAPSVPKAPPAEGSPPLRPSIRAGLPRTHLDEQPPHEARRQFSGEARKRGWRSGALVHRWSPTARRLQTQTKRRCIETNAPGSSPQGSMGWPRRSREKRSRHGYHPITRYLLHGVPLRMAPHGRAPHFNFKPTNTEALAAAEQRTTEVREPE